MIKSIRDYIDLHINSLDREFKPHKQPNTNDGIGSTRIEKTYWIETSSVNTIYDGTLYQDSININLEIATKGGRKPTESHDDLWCFAFRLRDILVKRSNIKNANFTNVQVDSINPVLINDNLGFTKLGLSITIITTNNMF